MAKITIETKDVFGSAFNHAYLVLTDDDGQEYVIRGGPQFPKPSEWIMPDENGDGIINGQGHLRTYPNTDPETFTRVLLSETDDDRRDDESAESRGAIELDLQGRDPHEIWGLMEQQARAIHISEMEYEPFSANSNSTIASVLQAVGFNFDALEPKQSGEEFVLHTAKENTFNTLSRSLTGYEENPNDGVLVGSYSSDVLSGGGGSDLIFDDPEILDRTVELSAVEIAAIEGSVDFLEGGTGDDWLIGSEGENHLSGGAGNDFLETSNTEYLQVLNGDSGNDYLFGMNFAQLNGGVDDDILESAGDGAVFLNGGEGNDTYLLNAYVNVISDGSERETTNDGRLFIDAPFDFSDFGYQIRGGFVDSSTGIASFQTTDLTITGHGQTFYSGVNFLTSYYTLENMSEIKLAELNASASARDGFSGFSDNALFMECSVQAGSSSQYNWTVISNFENGDFGIHLEYDETPTSADEDLLSYYGNDGIYRSTGADDFYQYMVETFEFYESPQMGPSFPNPPAPPYTGGDEPDRYVTDPFRADLFDGASSVDTVILKETSIVNLLDQSQNDFGAAGDTYLNTERFVLSNRGDDYFLGDENDNIVKGRAGDDTLIGLGGNDRLIGGDGSDVLIGGAGRDVLFGGASSDTFIIGQGSERDVIKDFEVGIDTISLDQDLLDGADSALDFAKQKDGKVVFNFGDERLVLQDVTLDQLSDDDFSFF